MVLNRVGVFLFAERTTFEQLNVGGTAGIQNPWFIGH